MYCFGCGIDVPKTNDRRALDSPEAEDVVIVWRAFLGKSKEEDKESPYTLVPKCLKNFKRK